MDSSVPLRGHGATGRVLTTTAWEGAGPVIWKRPCEQTEYKQAAPREVRVSPGSPTPFCPWVFLPSLPRRPGSSCQLLSTKCLQPHPPERPFQTTSPTHLHLSSAVSDQVWCPPPEQGWPGYSTDPDIQAGLALPMGLLGGERRSGVRLRTWWLNQKLPLSWLPQAQPPRAMGPRMKRKRLARQPLGGALGAVVCCHTASIQENTAHQPSLGPVPFKEVQSCGGNRPAGRQSEETTAPGL